LLVPASSPAPSYPETTAEAPPAPAEPRPEFGKSRGDLDTAITAAIAGFAPDGPAVHRSLAAFEPLPFHMEKGRYYTVTATLDPGAQFSAEAQGRGVSILLHQDRDYFTKSPGVVGPGGVIGGNAQQDKIQVTYGKPEDDEIDMQFDGLAIPDFAHPAVLGRGGITLQVYSRAITKRDDDADTRVEEARVAGWNQARTDMKKNICDRCLSDYNMCRVSAGGEHCAAKYKYCAKPAREREQPTWTWCGQDAP
jgi:hypothetical protein